MIMKALDTVTNCCYCSNNSWQVVGYAGSGWQWRILDPGWHLENTSCRRLSEVSNGQAQVCVLPAWHPAQIYILWSLDGHTTESSVATHQRCGGRMERIETDGRAHRGRAETRHGEGRGHDQARPILWSWRLDWPVGPLLWSRLAALLVQLAQAVGWDKQYFYLQC